MRTRFSRTNCWISYAVRTGWMGTCWTRHDQTWGILAERLRLNKNGDMTENMIFGVVWIWVIFPHGLIGEVPHFGTNLFWLGLEPTSTLLSGYFFDCILNDFEQLTSFIVSLAHNSISQYQTHELHGVTLLVWCKVGSHENHRFSRMSIRPMHVGYPVRKSARGFSTVSLKLGCQVNS